MELLRLGRLDRISKDVQAYSLEKKLEQRIAQRKTPITINIAMVI